MAIEKTSWGTTIFTHSFQIDHQTQKVIEKGDPIQTTETAKTIYHSLFAQLRNSQDWKAQTQRITIATWTEATLIAEALTYFLGGAEISATHGNYSVGSYGYYHYLKK